MQKFLLATACAAIFATGCKDHPSTASDENIKLIPLKTFKYDSADLKSGTPVRILAFSGAEIGHGDSSCYSEFIVLNPATGDTLRILAALIAVNDGANGTDKPTYTPTASFDGNAKVYDATFETPSANADMFLALVATSGEGSKSPDPTAKPDQEFVVVDNNPDYFARPFKTAKGILHFDRHPW